MVAAECRGARRLGGDALPRTLFSSPPSAAAGAAAYDIGGGCPTSRALLGLLGGARAASASLVRCMPEGALGLGQGGWGGAAGGGAACVIV